MANRSFLASIASLAALLLALAPGPARAGPPFLTDDPQAAETGHWEIYAPLVEVAGRGTDFAGTMATEVNYGAAPGLQLALALPVAFTHDSSGWRWGAGDIAVAVKYRFYHDEDAGLSVAIDPAMTLPTGSNGMSAGKVTALLPVWAQKDIGPWSIFGGGGYAINPGAGNRDYWTGGIAVTRQFGERLLIGVEAYREGAGTVGGRAATSLGLGAIYQPEAPFNLLLSGGPTFEDGGGGAGFHAFVGLELDL